jgi:hypothetical protein
MVSSTSMEPEMVCRKVRREESHLDSMCGRGVDTSVKKEMPVPVAYWTQETAMRRR